MNILRKLTIKNLKLNKKRTIGTIIGVILSVAMLCAVAKMVTSFRYSLIKQNIDAYGYYHLVLHNISDDDEEVLKLNKEIKDINSIYNLGYAEFENNFSIPYLAVKSASKEVLKDTKFLLTDGRYPRNDSEIIVNNYLLSDDLKIGDKITLTLGDRYTLEDEDGYKEKIYSYLYYEGEEFVPTKEAKKYTIVGSYKTKDYSRSMYAFTLSSEHDSVTSFVSLKNPKKYDSVIPPLVGANSYLDALKGNGTKTYNINNNLLRWEAMAFSDQTNQMLFSVAGVVIAIIMVTSIFCIRNSFAISVMEKMKTYGMLASVGATKKQIRKTVLYEVLFISLVGIPLGVLSGLLGDFILFKVVNLIADEELLGIKNFLIFKTSIWPILVSVILGFLTVYLSGIASAIKASKVSPIDNLRNSRDIKIKSKKLKTPKIINKMFKTGGVLAYKNLKRSKKKYKTTVISLTVSVFVFISISAFISEGFSQSTRYYTDRDYNFYIAGLSETLSDDYIKIIKAYDSVEEAYLVQTSKNEFVYYDKDNINLNTAEVLPNMCDKYDEDEEEKDKTKCKDYLSLDIVLLDEDAYQKYVKDNKLDYDEVKDKAILYNTYLYYDSSIEKTVEDKRYDLDVGDKMKIYEQLTLDNEEKEKEVEIGGISNVAPMGMENVSNYGGTLIFHKDYTDIDSEYSDLYIETSDPDGLEDSLEDLNKDLNYYNIDASVRAEKSMLLIVAIFLYGFIAVISLVGVTNIFNTITSNMELRAKEFAMLKSIGMTRKEFNHMVNLETLFYSFESLLYGIILGIIGSIALHSAFNEGLVTKYIFPYKAIIISIIFVFVIVFMIMRYSISKINKQNTIETIRNENA